ncbi:alpha/beta fold hydrolase [Halalkalibacter krulwichiae]|uniref:Soluble epoxide hydrolase n=1 Tax=Halalkalibacter krulwichiae TaxID=199441 RepID=A0A1Y9THD5_9BACI|nr:alpha/beta hydrolase [Halalkalibacter krulwichiae]ARK28579.1 Soluble epoxide hydrolase [Halalkalibacter krulwichiae]
MTKVEFIKIETNGVRIHMAVSGPTKGPLIILLHGFPEFWYGFRKQIEPLVKAGYRVVVPDQRGYNFSEKPEKIENYTLDQLARDVIGIIQFFKREKACIIGHDWGGLVAWHLASYHGQYVDKLIVINSPHPLVMMKCYVPIQWVRSLYILFFQMPNVPEQLLKARKYALLANVLKRTSKEGTFSHDELENYKESWSNSRAISSMINWYRALRKDLRLISESPKVQVPVQILWGQKDVFLAKGLAKRSLQYCTDGSLVLISATHWVQHEQPLIVNQLILEFLKS